MALPIWNTEQGIILTAQEGDSVNFQLQYSNPGPGLETIVKIAGELPASLNIDNTGLITGTIENIEFEKDFVFAMRIANDDGSVDRSFTIKVTDIVPTWSDPSSLGNFLCHSIFEYQFSINDPGFTRKDFLKIGGELPPGLSLNEDGFISGLIGKVDIDTTYNFDVRAILDDVKFIDRSFEIIVEAIGNRPPLWNTPEGLIGDAKFGDLFEFQFSAGDPELAPLNYSGLGLPSGLSLTTTGFLSGTFGVATPQLVSFTIQANDGATIVPRIFTINANNEIITPITWITPSGDLGSINEGEKSLFKVEAESISRWIRYEIDSGTLPPGLILDDDTGEFWGKIEEQGANATYNFTVKAFNQDNFILQDFSIDVVDSLDSGSVSVNATIFGDETLRWFNLFSISDIKPEHIFEQGNPQFGTVQEPKINLIENLNTSTANDIFNSIKDIEKTRIIFGNVQVAKAVKNNEIIYEVLYRKIFDEEEGAERFLTMPNSSISINTGSLLNLRSQLLDDIGVRDSEQMDLWMNSEQIIGDPSTIIGWIPAAVFAYVKPGTGQDIADDINAKNETEDILYSKRVLIDRVLMEPTADNSFEPRLILFKE